MVSAVPWKWMTGTGARGVAIRGGKANTPATGAMAAMVSASSQPSRCERMPPFDMPVA